MHFITRVMPINDIDGKSHKMEQITRLVIHGLGGVHTNTHIRTFTDESDYKKPGARLVKPLNPHILFKIIKLHILPQARMIRGKRWLLPIPYTHFMYIL